MPETVYVVESIHPTTPGNMLAVFATRTGADQHARKVLAEIWPDLSPRYGLPPVTDDWEADMERLWAARDSLPTMSFEEDDDSGVYLTALPLQP